MDTNENTRVAVPLWALNFILENAVFQDEGPPGEGWRSVGMKRAVNAIDDAMKDKTP